MPDLGSTTDPVALVPSDPAALHEVALGGVSAAGATAGIGLAGAGAIDLALNAAGPDRVTPFRVDADAEPVLEPPPFPPPTEITGMTKRAAGRDGGVGVSDEAMADAVLIRWRHPSTNLRLQHIVTKAATQWSS